uniref:Ig-like domain-containing protein n=1 Tax=Astyanax mexicanus TaxID=7994 RepID=A0A8B9J6K2_ASTMX
MKHLLHSATVGGAHKHKISILPSGALSVTEVVHSYRCSDGIYTIYSNDNTDGGVVWMIDGEEEYHADFKDGRGVVSLPKFATLNYTIIPAAYEHSIQELQICRYNLKYNAPRITMYPKNDEQLGVVNELICLVTEFYPPSLRISWTKNNENVTEDVYMSQYYPNEDYTFTLFSSISIVPEQGDIYSCTVEHIALQQPQTRIWVHTRSNSGWSQVDPPEDGPLVFCGVGVAVGLLGIATGSFFFVKGSHS